MKERPILFSAPMVRALLDGSKTQTRRVVKKSECWPASTVRAVMLESRGTAMAVDANRCTYGPEIKCPYGQTGDQLWVKETWRTAKSLDNNSPNAIGEMCIEAGYKKPWSPLAYEADGYRNTEWRGFEMGADAESGKTRVSIHMPRWASRITLQITDVRVERMQDISEADALAEGIQAYEAMDEEGRCHCYHANPPSSDPADGYRSAKRAYQALWESINGPGGWDANPWVWVVQFKVIKP